MKPGRIVDKKGRVLGKHTGLPNYTIGQRRGLGIAAKAPLYVTALRPETNEVVVGESDDLFRKKLLASDLDFTDGTAPGKTFRCEAKIRYGIRVHPCTVNLEDNGRAVVTFDESQRAITPGQSVVFYNGDQLIGGGTIKQAL